MTDDYVMAGVIFLVLILLSVAGLAAQFSTRRTGLWTAPRKAKEKQKENLDELLEYVYRQKEKGSQG